MKKFFLIPLMTLVCSVMAWGTNVAQIDEVQFESLSAAIASLDGDEDGKIDPIGSTTYKTITLLASIEENVTVDMSLVVNNDTKTYLEFDLAGFEWNGNIAWPAGSSSYAILRVKNGTYHGTISVSGGSGSLNLQEPGAYGLSGTITTSGSSTMNITLPSTGTFSANLNLGTPTNVSIFSNLTFTGNLSVSSNRTMTVQGKFTGEATFAENVTLKMDQATAEFCPSAPVNGNPIYNLTGGKTNFDPTSYLTKGYYSTYAEGKYTINVNPVYNNTKALGYPDFISAYEAASIGDELELIVACTVGTGEENYVFDKAVHIVGGTKALTLNCATAEFNNEDQIFNGYISIPTNCTATFTAGTYSNNGYDIVKGNLVINGGDYTVGYIHNIEAGKQFTLTSGTCRLSGANLTVKAGATCEISGGEVLSSGGTYINLMGGTSAENATRFIMSGGRVVAGSSDLIKTYSSSNHYYFRITGGEIVSAAYRCPFSCSSNNIAANSEFKNFSVTNTHETAGGLSFTGSSSVTLENVSIETNGVAFNCGSKNVTITMNNCSFVSHNDNAISITKSGSHLKIKGGSFKSEAASNANKQVINAVKVSFPDYVDYENTPIDFYTNLSAGPSINNGNNGIYSLVRQGSSNWWRLQGTAPAPFANVRKNGGDIIGVATMADVLNLFPLSDIETLDITLLRDYKLDLSDPLAVEANKVCNLNLNGHKLTVDGTSRKLYVSGTLNINGESAGSEIKISKGDGIYVEDGGVVNVSGGKYTTTSSGRVFENDGTLNLNNAVIDAYYRGIYNSGIANLVNTSVFSDANYAIYTSGTELKQAKLYIKGLNTDSIRSNSSTKNGSYSYAIRVHNNAYCSVTKGGANNDENINISGVQGGLAVSDDAIADIYGGKFDTRTCKYYGGSYYALYVAVDAIANVYGGKFSTAEDAVAHVARPAIFCGNNDVTSILGIANIYGGVMSNKAYVQHAPTNTFPASIPDGSQWYSSFGADAPLPAGYEYEAISSGDDYNAGYRWRVICTNEDTKEVNVDDPEATIPWQQNTTWDPNASPEATGIVPEESTIVTIPVDATVVVKNDPNLDTLAVAEQVFVNQGATLKVETGTTLNVGDGGVNIANGGQIIVEPGAIVTIGTAGMITTEDEALVIEATEEDQGVFLLQPDVNENTQPKATVKLVTKCKQINASEYLWERFAIPTKDGEQTTFSIEGGTAGIETYGGVAFDQGLYGWSDEQQDWVGLARFKDMEPFKGYQLSNNSLNGNVTYVFEGNLVGNTDQAYEFAQTGFGFFGNSYTGDIDILKFFETFGENMQKTIWIYDYYTDGFKAITEDNYGSIYYGTRKARHGAITDIRSMQAFLMNAFEEGDPTAINYAAAIWGNPKYGLVHEQNNGGAPKRIAVNEDRFTVYVAGEKQEDEVSFIRNNEYSSAFDNGADASKWMNKGINLYVATENGEMAVVASDEVADMTISFQSGKETEYTLGFDNLRGETFELRDVITGATIQMAEDVTYMFTQEPNTTIPARFQIIGAKKVITGMEDIEEGANVQQKVMKNGVLYILRDNKWYNAQGQLMK